MNIFYVIVIAGIFASACSQILLKQSANQTHKHWIFEFLNWRVALAYTIFLGSTLINVFGLKYGVNLKDMPILESLGYIFVPLLSMLFLAEKINKRTLAAMFIIFIGIIVFYQ